MHVVYICVCLKAGFIILSSCEKLDCEIQQMVAELREVLDSREAVSNTTLENFTIYFEQFTAHTHVHARMHTRMHVHTHTHTHTHARTHTHTHAHRTFALLSSREEIKNCSCWKSREKTTARWWRRQARSESSSYLKTQICCLTILPLFTVD